jgi:hypothetical protein
LTTKAVSKSLKSHLNNFIINGQLIKFSGIYFTNKYLKIFTINFLSLPKKSEKVAKINFNSKSDLMKKYLFLSTGKSENSLLFISSFIYGITFFFNKN